MGTNRYKYLQTNSNTNAKSDASADTGNADSNECRLTDRRESDRSKPGKRRTDVSLSADLDSRCSDRRRMDICRLGNPGRGKCISTGSSNPTGHVDIYTGSDNAEDNICGSGRMGTSGNKYI